MDLLVGCGIRCVCGANIFSRNQSDCSSVHYYHPPPSNQPSIHSAQPVVLLLALLALLALQLVNLTSNWNVMDVKSISCLFLKGVLASWDDWWTYDGISGKCSSYLSLLRYHRRYIFLFISLSSVLQIFISLPFKILKSKQMSSSKVSRRGSFVAKISAHSA